MHFKTFSCRSLRQECLLKSLNAAKENERIEMNEDKNDTLTISLNKPCELYNIF